MKVTGIWALGIIGVLALGSIVLSSDVTAQTSGPKLGFVDLERILQNADIFKQKAAELRTERDEIKKKLEETAANLKQEREDLEAQKGLLKSEDYTKKRTELDKKYLDFRAAVDQKNREFDEAFKKETIEPLREKLQTIVEEIAKQEGYDFIFKRADLAYGAAQYEITDKVISKLNATATEKKETEKK
ncbi:MAG TPA: OmpH family outer membrane protein [bacterium]|nr:OmpH family outer membrane protein [bacterium]HPO08529.1 OmpH family outer membrane protein [bacterium]HQO34741.1 OmpH family outer membrane protein [bacterium]HQP98064.1 OmpH family outer membrane protein [bacterium]